MPSYGRRNILVTPSELLNMRRKKKKPPNVTKVLSNVILVLLTVKMKLSNVTKNKGTTECNKSTITYVVSTAKCEDGIIKCVEKKKKEPLNMTKLLLDVMLILSNETMEPSNVRKKIKELPNVTKIL